MINVVNVLIGRNIADCLRCVWDKGTWVDRADVLSVVAAITYLWGSIALSAAEYARELFN